jgi:4-amino-4-deoxy-L-arabinose transferase-like glycosyltransferase
MADSLERRRPLVIGTWPGRLEPSRARRIQGGNEFVSEPSAPRDLGKSIPRSWLLAGMLILVARLVALLASAPNETLVGDEPYYDSLARGLIAHGTYEVNGLPSVHRPPGWPFTLSLIYRFLGDSRRSVIVVQSLFDVGTIFATSWLARRLFRSRLAAAFGFLLAASWPPFFRESLLLQTEPLFTMLVAFLLARFWVLTERPGLRIGFSCGVLAGLASLVRPTGLVVLAGLGLGWLVQSGYRALRSWKALVMVGVGVAVIVLPWTIRNYRVVGSFVPVAVGTGEQFFLGSLLETDGRWDHNVWWPIRDGVIRDEETRLGRPLSAVERDHVWLEHGRKIWREHPAESLWITAKRFWRLVALPVSADRLWLRMGFAIALVAIYALSIPLGVRGLAARDGPLGYAGVLLVMVLFYAIVSTSVYTISRFFEPVRTALLVLSAGALARPLERPYE